MLPILLVVFAASGAEVKVGGALDLMGGVTACEGCPPQVGGGLREAEGDLRVADEHLAFEIQLDTAASVGSDGVFIYKLAPERLVGEGFGDAYRVSAGIFQAPFRIESVDPWVGPQVMPSLFSRRVPGAILGGEVTVHSEVVGATVVIGGQPATTNVFELDDFSGAPLPFLAGLRARVRSGNVDVGGGAWFGGGLDGFGFGGAELGARVDVEVVSVYGDLMSNFADSHSIVVGTELWPEAPVSPSARVEFDAPQGFGVAVGAGATFFELLRIKAEASYQAGNPGVYLEVALFSFWPEAEPDW
jgi:hypothetical protein